MKTHSILIIDDDEGFRKTLSDVLTIKGYRTLTAKDGKEGLRIFGEQAADLVLIDLKLPDMSGLEVIDRVKQRSPLTQTIILTGHAALETSIEATNRGAFSYVRKPCDLDELLVHITRALEKKQNEETILRLASFPELNPIPIVEIDSTGRITYLNPAAMRLFPELRAAGPEHPLMRDVNRTVVELREGGKDQAMREVRIDDATYIQHMSRVSADDLIRMYVIDITERKRTEEALKRQLDEVERLNRLMVGRELKMEEMRNKIRDLETSFEAIRSKERA